MLAGRGRLVGFGIFLVGAGLKGVDVGVTTGGEDRTNTVGDCVGFGVVGADVGIFVGKDVVGRADGALVGAAMFMTVSM